MLPQNTFPCCCAWQPSSPPALRLQKMETHTRASCPHHTDQPGAALSSVRWSLSKRSPFPFRHRSTPKSPSTSPFWQTLAAAQPPKKKKLYQLLLPKPILTGARFPRSPPISGERRRNTRGSSCPEACAGHKETHQKSEKTAGKKYAPQPQAGQTY